MTAQQRSTFWQLMGMWALAFAAIIVFRIFTSQAKTVATVAFLYLPIWWIDRNGKTLADYGLTLDHWRDDLKALSWALLLVFPAFIGGFFVFIEFLLPHFSDKTIALFTPYSGVLPHIAFRLPRPPLPGSVVATLGFLGVPAAGGIAHATDLVLLVLDQFLVVGLSEEFFYRGFLQKRFREVFPGGRVIWGVRFGAAFWLTQVLFAVGHLAEFHPWRLAVFFPAILFGILREKTGRLPAGIAFHALCNLAIFTLEASTFPS